MVAAGERIHVIGIAGAGPQERPCLPLTPGPVWMAAMRRAIGIHRTPAEAGITVLTGHDAGHLEGVDRVAVSAALRLQPDLPELAAARERADPGRRLAGDPGRADGERGRLGVAVAGTHGKSTATALLGHLLVAAGHDPTVEVGALIPAWGASARSGGGLEFVAEADEYDGNFLHLHPSAVLLTTIEMDHPDVFANEDAVYDMFVRFLGGMSSHELVGGRLLWPWRGCGHRGGPGPPGGLGRPARRVRAGTDIAAANITFDQRTPASTCSAGGTDRAWPARTTCSTRSVRWSWA